MRTLCLIALFAAACGSSDTKETGSLFGPPDANGTYNTLITGATGCDSNYAPVTDWAQGYMGISGDDPSALTFSFRDGISFEGWVSDSWTYQFGGFFTYGTYEESVAHTGVLSMEDEQMVASGDFEVEVRDTSGTTPECTITARMDATRISSD